MLRIKCNTLSRLVLALSVLAGSHALAQDESPTEPPGETGRAVRISGSSWEAVDGAAAAGFLVQYQYSQGVSVIPASYELWQEPLTPEELEDVDLLLVDAGDESLAALQAGMSLPEVLSQVVGAELGVLVPASADELEEEAKAQVARLVLVLPAGTLAELFPQGNDVEVDAVVTLSPERLLGVRAETPCDDKCDEPAAATEVSAISIDNIADVPLPLQVLENLPPETESQPVRNRGMPHLAVLAENDDSTVFRAEGGSGANLYQWFLINSEGQSWSLGETTTSAVEFTLVSQNALESGVTLVGRSFTWNPASQTWAAMLYGPKPGTPWPPPPPPPPPPPQPFVGVIPEGQGCPNWNDLVVIHMDDEDKRNANGRSGWIGGITSNNNTTWRFCRVDGRKFKSLSQASIQQNHYAVLLLGSGGCPNGSRMISRYFDNEDTRNANWSQGPVYPNGSDRNTTLKFCVFRGNTEPGGTMAAMPDLGFRYGVFAANDFSKRISTGFVHTDDEDTRNQNSIFDPFGLYGDASRFLSVGGNTRVNLARVK